MTAAQIGKPHDDKESELHHHCSGDHSSASAFTRNEVCGRRLPAARLSSLVCAILLFTAPPGLFVTTARGAAAADSVWIESEAPSSIAPAHLKINIAGWGHPEYLSGGKWIQISIDADQVAKEAPPDGVLISYRFTAPRTASYDIWNRIGYEKVRSPFEWRVDAAPWSTVTPVRNTVDVEDLQDWNPVAWLDMGTQALEAGPHSLQIRLLRSTDEHGNAAHILYASDALFITPDSFHPDGPRRPGDPGSQTEADRAAAAHVFIMPPVDSFRQQSLSLKGDWEIAPDDELVVDDRTAPIKDPPPQGLIWQAIPTPSDRNQSIPELTYVHRYYLRTRVSVPAAAAGRSFYLHLPSVNLLATAFVNGEDCGSTRTPFAAWDCDITRALRPGQVNTIVIGIKDPFYALADEADAGHPQYVPYSFWHYNTTNQLDFPILSHYQTGILQRPTLVSAGRAYTADVFAIPSVKKKTLGLEITVHNPTLRPLEVLVQNEVIPLAGGPVEKRFAPAPLQVPAGGSATLKLSETWAHPALWWPDDPRQYRVVTRLSIGGQNVDERTTHFGFREWSWNGPSLTLNGAPWHGHADLAAYGEASDAAVALWHHHGQNMERLWAETAWGGKEIEDALDFYDSRGIPIRRTGIFDGEGAAGFYNLTESIRENEKNVTVARRALFDNWRSQLAAWVKSQRNHPSIFVWSMENEITFINSSVFGLNPYTDPEMKKAAEMLAAIDPTRPQMVDGGNALLDQSLPIYGGHYMEPALSSLPEGAYDFAAMEHRQKWPITGVKPILFGESFFANGTELGTLAAIGGERTFLGKAESHPAVGLVARMLSEGYRWNGISFHFWFGGETDAHYIAWQPIAVLCRQWDWTFRSGQQVRRTLGVFNDTRLSDPITLTWKLVIAGKTVASRSQPLNIPAGANRKFEVTLPMPTVSARAEGAWTLDLAVRGNPAFHDVKDVSVLPLMRTAAPAGSAGARRRLVSDHSQLAGRLLVYDPAGSARLFLRQARIPFTELHSLDTLPESGKALIVGDNVMDASSSASSKLAAYASAGRAVIVLEQKFPLRYQALPGAMAVDTNEGSVAFAEDLENPLLAGLKQKDFFTWDADGLVYRNAYAKPTSGGRSLVQCGDGLQDTALVEMQAGKGVLLLSQLLIEEKLASNAVAQRLLLNLVRYGVSYRQVFRPVAVAAADNPPLIRALNAAGLRYRSAADPLAALGPSASIAIISASPVNLHALAAHPAAVNAFTRRGGWIILNNLTPPGLADYNRLVGFDHMIRPFGQEKVGWPAVRSPLTAGLATSNIVMGSGKQIFDFASGQYPDTNAYSYVVDYDEVAPFGKSPFFAYSNITNNYTMADGFWPLIINLPVPEDGKPVEAPITLPKPQTLTRFTWVSDNNYEGTTGVRLVFNGKDTVSFKTRPDGDPQTFAITPPRTAQRVTLQVTDWQHLPARLNNGKVLIGIDNIYLKAARPLGFYQKVRPLLNIGAMMEYPRGQGGLVLCNVKYTDTEAVPENALKKQAILAAILRNLQAPFRAGPTIIAGARNLSYQPIDLSRKANQYRGDRGWFGDRGFTFADLPAGRHIFAGVPYNVYEMATSIVPTVVMLGGAGVPGALPNAVTGIPVNRKADALFFLQAARIDQPRSRDEVKQNKQYEMADYVIHYVDGQQVKAPVYSEINLDNYRQENPTALAGAQIAWTRPFPGTPYSAVAYSMQWNNPRPEVPIASVDLVYGPDRRGVPALIALTAASEG